METINRAAVIIKPKQPFVDWINYFPDDKNKYTLEQMSKKENLTFLIPEFLCQDESLNYVKKNYSYIFEFELWGWITDKKLWPENRTWKMFQNWFEIEINSEVIDLVDEKIEKEDF